AATIPGRQGSPSRPNTASMSAGERAIWNASSAVTPRCGGIEQPEAGTTRENQLPSNMVARAKTSVSAQRERGEDCTGIVHAYRVRTRIASVTRHRRTCHVLTRAHACRRTRDMSTTAGTRAPGEFGGVIGRYYWESTPWWPKPQRARAGAPNVLLV